MKMISLARAGLLALFSFVTGFFINLMIQVFWSSILRDYLIAAEAAGGSTRFLASLTMWIGSIFGLGSSIIVSVIDAKTTRSTRVVDSFIAGLLSFLASFVGWYIYCSYWIMTSTTLSQGLNSIQVLLLSANSPLYYALSLDTTTGNVTMLWQYEGISYSLAYFIFIKLIGQNVKKPKRERPFL